jgi:hypothetical protein
MAAESVIAVHQELKLVFAIIHTNKSFNCETKQNKNYWYYQKLFPPQPSYGTFIQTA